MCLFSNAYCPDVFSVANVNFDFHPQSGESVTTPFYLSDGNNNPLIGSHRLGVTFPSFDDLLLIYPNYLNYFSFCLVTYSIEIVGQGLKVEFFMFCGSFFFVNFWGKKVCFFFFA